MTITRLAATAALAVLLLTAHAQAAPKDWGDNEWYQYFDAAVGLLAGEAPGHVAKEFGGVAAAPIADVYSALSGAGAAVKPGLIFWLHRKLEEATLAGDTARADRYQAFHTALSTGDDSRLKELLEEVGRKQAGAGATGPSDPGGATFPGYGKLSQHPFNGTWKTTWGVMTLQVSDNGAARGSYTYKTPKGNSVKGTLEGRIKGDYVLEVTRWTESVPGEFAAGTGTMTITADGKHFQGDYQTTEGDTGSGEWSGDRVK